jgi:hypothetical protein
MLINFALDAETGFTLLSQWCPFKIKKGNMATIQYTNTDFLSLFSTPVTFHWTLPLNAESGFIEI